MGVFRQFPYSNFHEMNMDEIIKIVKNMLEDWAQYYDTWDDWKEQVTQEWSEMQNFINNYFDNLNVQTEINNKITAMVNSGEFGQIVDPYVPPAVASWLADHITQPVGVVIDTSLSVAGACADAKATGDAIDDLRSDLQAFMYGLDKSFSIPTGSNSYQFNLGFIKGEEYTFTNNTSSACSLAVEQKDGTSTTLSSNLAAGASLKFTPQTDDYILFKGWFNGTGTMKVECNYSSMEAIKELQDATTFNKTFVNGDLETGFIGTDGVFVSNNSWGASDYVFVPLNNGGQLTIKSTIYGNGGLAFYNRDKECLGYINGNNASSYGLTPGSYPEIRTINVPTDTEYIRISVFYVESWVDATKIWINGGVHTNDVVNSLEILTSNIIDEAQRLNKTTSDLKEYIYGVKKTFTIDASNTYFFPILLLKGKSYTFINNTSSGCSLGIRKTINSPSTIITSVVNSGASFNFTVQDDDYNYIGGWFNASGTIEVISDFVGIDGNDKLMSLLKWHDGKVYMGINGVPHGIGLNIPNVTDAYLDGYSILFEDDFNGNSLDTNVWEYELGYKRNNEPQVYKSENISLSNSNMIITAIREHAQAIKDGVLTDFDWTSGSVIYRNNLNFDRVEAKILFPRISGAFPAFWGIGTIGTYPDSGEIDIVEGNCYEPFLDSVVVGAYYTDTNGVQKRTGTSYANMFDQNGYHVYSLERKDGCLYFLIDDFLISTIEITSEMSEFNNPYDWILNLALSPVASRIPSNVNEYKMYVDWFRVYERD